MLEQRYNGSSVTVNGKLWITGGQNAEGKHLNSTEFISPGQLRTIKGPNLPEKNTMFSKLSICLVLLLKFDEVNYIWTKIS